MSSESTQTIGTGYFTTLQGICKVIQIICSFVGVLLVGIGNKGSTISIFDSAAAISIVFSTIFLILYVNKTVEKLPLPWNIIQFFYHIILSVYYIIAAALVLDIANDDPKIIGGTVLGLFAIIAHLIDSIDNYKKQPLC